MLAKVLYMARPARNRHMGKITERCGYSDPILRPVWEFEFLFVGNGFVA
jgi:hypothetical protein